MSVHISTDVYKKYHTLANRARIKAVKYSLNSIITDHNILPNSTSPVSKTCVKIVPDVSLLTLRVGRVMQILSVKSWTCQGQFTVDINQSRILPCSLGFGLVLV